jgi:tetratricopeptide (TPR) repeat protein
VNFRFSYIVLFFCICAGKSFSQSNAYIQRQAEAAVQNKDWFSAVQHYNRLYFRDSSDVRVQYDYAEASRMNFDLDLALRLYVRIAAFDDDRKYPLCYYWIGQILKNKGNYKEAKKWFVKFSKLKIKKPKFNFDYYLKKSKLEIEACDLAQIWMKNPVGPKLEHLDTNINSKVSEYAAFEKDSTLYFSSLKNGSKKDVNDINFNKIYKSEIKNTKWQKAKELDTNINSSVLHNANICFSDDYKQMIVARCKAKNASEYTCDLYLSKFESNKWQLAQRMDAPLNLDGVNTTQPCFGKLDGKTVLFFSSNRAGGKGGLDIWYAVRKDDGTFDQPVNCGELVNTPDDEITPYFVNERNMLFFSSTYHKGMGGFDIFKSEYKSGTFGEPQNAGYPINSSYNDIYYSVNKSRDKAYVSSNRVGSFFENKLNCCNDIYRFDIEPLSIPPQPVDTLELVKGQMKVLVPLTLYFHNDEPDPKTKNVITTKNYETTYNEYKARVPEYLSEYSKGLEKDQKQISESRIENFFSDSVDAGMEDLRKFVDLTKKVLLKGQTVKITMKGYCSPLASTDYNINLAKRRISSLRNYFRETDNGWFMKYINNETPGEGKIVFEDVDIGELPASKVSDDLKDKRNSVYSPFAAQERKIQILAVGFGE